MAARDFHLVLYFLIPCAHHAIIFNLQLAHAFLFILFSCYYSFSMLAAFITARAQRQTLFRTTIKRSTIHLDIDIQIHDRSLSLTHFSEPQFLMRQLRIHQYW